MLCRGGDSFGSIGGDGFGVSGVSSAAGGGGPVEELVA
jgi:hypothetical protein